MWNIIDMMLGDEFILILSYPHMGPIQDELADDVEDERSSFFRVGKADFLRPPQYI
jgi:hypothetical protein